MALIDWSEALAVGVPEMDRTHREFVELLNRLGEAGTAERGALFDELIQHTEAHFAREEELMEQSRFPAISEHRGEHRRVLGEMRQMRHRPRPFADAWIREQLPAWFLLHRDTMDMATAVYIKKSGLAVDLD